MINNNFYLAIISSKRSHNVQKLQQLIQLPCTWFVGEGEGNDYLNAGATSVIESGKLCKSRNIALRTAFLLNFSCVQVSDDLVSINQAVSKDKIKNISLLETIQIVSDRTHKMGLYLGGVAPTKNLFFYNPKKTITTTGFIVADFIYVRPCDLFFDENLHLKEDYDYTLAHITKKGGALRCNDLLLEFKHRTNHGGAVAFRTPQKEQQAIAYLKSKWGSLIKDNPKRENEILINL